MSFSNSSFTINFTISSSARPYFTQITKHQTEISKTSETLYQTFQVFQTIYCIIIVLLIPTIQSAAPE